MLLVRKDFKGRPVPLVRLVESGCKEPPATKVSRATLAYKVSRVATATKVSRVYKAQLMVPRALPGHKAFKVSKAPLTVSRATRVTRGIKATRVSKGIKGIRAYKVPSVQPETQGR